MPLRKIEFLSIWEIGHRWEGVDPESVPTQRFPAPVRDRLRQLSNATRSVINAYNPHGEVIPLERLWFGWPKTKVAKHLDKAVQDP